MPGLFPDIHWGIPSLPWLPPEIPWETHVSPEDTLTFPAVIPDGPNYPLTFPDGHLKVLYIHWHPLLVWKRRWNFVFKIPGKACISKHKHISLFKTTCCKMITKKYLGIDITMTYDPGSCKQVHWPFTKNIVLFSNFNRSRSCLAEAGCSIVHFYIIVT